MAAMALLAHLPSQALLAPGEPWDLLDIDAQGMEHPFLHGIVGWLRHRVRRLHVSTHDRAIHWEILQWLKEMGMSENGVYPQL
jgi:hypothetical protein